MEKVLYVLIDIILQIVMMCVFEQKVLVKSKIRVGVSACIVIIAGLLMSTVVTGDMESETLNLFVNLIVAYVVCQLSVKRFLIVYVISTFVVAVAQGIITFIIPGSASNPVLIKLITLIAILGVGHFLLSVLKKKINFSVLPKSVLFGTGLMFCALTVVMAGMSSYTSESGKSVSIILTVAIVVAGVAMFAITLASISTEISKVNLQKEKDILQNYNEQQKNYYELVLKSEEDTRRFRHDMLNHMLCLENYLEEGKIEDCRTYITNISDSLNYSRKKLYYTGNRISDVMLTNILENKKDDVDVSVTGKLKENLPIADFDLCIVISNIIKNAVEATNKQADEGNKYIKIKFTVGKRYIRIEERNSIDSNQVLNAEKFETTKEDKKAHGLGVKNVKMIVEKYNGTFKSEVQDKEFYVCVEMDMKGVK